MSSLDWPNFVLVSARRTLRRVFVLVFVLSVCEVNLIFLSYVTQSVVAVSVKVMSMLLSVIVGVIRVSVDFEGETFILFEYSHCLHCGTSWGQQKETMLATFKSLIESLFTYAAPIWFPNSSQTSIFKLQTLKNSALRITTGCVRMTAIDQLYTEAKVLKVDEHISRYALCSVPGHLFQPDHASFQTVQADSGPRKIKYTLQTAYMEKVEDRASAQR